MKKFKIDIIKIQDYLNKHSSYSIQEIYDHIKSLKVKHRTMEENVVFTYLFLNRKKLGIK